MDNIESEIFDGLTEIPIHGWPGTVVVTENKSKPLLAVTRSGDVILAVSEYGNGRVFFATHDSFMSLFKSSDVVEKKFLSNIKKWLTRSDEEIDDSQIFDISKATSDDISLDHYKIIKWKHDKKVSQHLQNNLLDYLENGGSLFCAATPWGYLQMNFGKTLNDLSMFRFLSNNFGLVMTDRCAEVHNNKVILAKNLAKYSNFEEALCKLECNDNLDLNLYCNTIDCGIEMMSKCGKLDNAALGKITESIIRDCTLRGLDPFPRKGHRVKNNEEKNMTRLLCRAMIERKTEKAPYIDQFPGDFSEMPELLTNVDVIVESEFAERISTGYYSPAAVTMEVCVLEGDFKEWNLRIGAHTDNISNCAHYDRWPIITTTHRVTKEFSVCSPFGGLVYFESPKSGKLTIQLSNVVETPYYDLTKPETIDNWHNRRYAKGLWAELGSEHVVFTCPVECIRNLEDPMPVLEFWDQILKAHHECRGTDPYDYKRERVVNDKQITCGDLHSGYPVSTHLDVCDPNFKECIFDVDKLRIDGSWGMQHEFGHNMQRSEWTFDGCGEVTVNIFSTHAMQFVIGKHILEQTWLLGQKGLFKRYFSKKPTYEDWKSNCCIALMTFVQLIKHFGWDPMKIFMKDYETDIKNKSPNLPKTNQDKIDQWVLRYSRIVGVNIKQQFEMWGLPVSQHVNESLHDLSNWCPIEEKDADVFFS